MPLTTEEKIRLEMASKDLSLAQGKFSRVQRALADAQRAATAALDEVTDREEDLRQARAGLGLE